MPSITRLRVQLITAKEAAELLNVNVRTIHSWIENDAIPYVSLPSSGGKPSYRIPLHGLLSSLSGNYDLARDVEQSFGAEEDDAAD
jgi:excisionase family DNA binding protein